MVLMEASGSSPNLFGYEAPQVPPLQRCIFKWLLSIGESPVHKHIKRETSNGFLVARILSHYYKDVSFVTLEDGLSDACKKENWSQICKVLKKRKIQIEESDVQKAILGDNDSITAILNKLYEHTTGKKLQQEKLLDVKNEVGDAVLSASGSPRLGGTQGHVKVFNDSFILTKEGT